MKLRDSPLFLDQSLHRAIAAELRNRGLDAVAAREVSLSTARDEEILAWAGSYGRVLITHDVGFGRRAVETVGLSTAVVILRPHLKLEAVSEQLDRVLDAELEASFPFLLTVQTNAQGRVVYRVRSLMT